MAGKSRMAAEIVQRHYQDSPILVPETGNALAELIRSGGVPEEAVIWLNELEEYLTRDGLTAGLVDQLMQNRNRIVATMRAGAFEQFQSTDQLRPTGSDVLELFERIWLDRELTATERSRLTRHIEDAQLRDSIERYGIAEYIGGAQWALDRFKAGFTQQPLGAACVRAAVDWRRIGMWRNMSRELLGKLAPHYLPRHRSEDHLPGRALDEALEWASARGNETVALLEKSSEGWRAFDFLVDYIGDVDLPIPNVIWDVILENATPDDARTASNAAYHIGRYDVAEKLVSPLAEAGDPKAWYNLGVVLERQGNLSEAERWWRLAAETGDPREMHNLGVLQYECGNKAEAEHWYRKGLEVGDIGAMVNLGVLLVERGELSEAERLYRKASGAGDVDAMVNLGGILEQRGDLDEAEHWWRLAAEAGDPGGMHNLGVLLHERGDETGAEHWYRQASKAGSLNSMQNLGSLVATRGNLTEAERLWTRAADLGHAGGTTARRAGLQ